MTKKHPGGRPTKRNELRLRQVHVRQRRKDDAQKAFQSEIETEFKRLVLEHWNNTLDRQFRQTFNASP